jgi:hypothetical protein
VGAIARVAAFESALLGAVASAVVALPAIRDDLASASSADVPDILASIALPFASVLPLCAILFGPGDGLADRALRVAVRYTAWVASIPTALFAMLGVAISVSIGGPPSTHGLHLDLATAVPSVMTVFVWCHLIGGAERPQRCSWILLWLMSGTCMLFLNFAVVSTSLL